MPAAEYIIVLASILVGLALADWATSLHRTLRSRRKVKWHLATPTFAFVVLLTVLEMWWSAYQALADVRTIGDFMVPMVQLLVLFLLASVAWPDEIPDNGLNLRDYYFESHRYAYSLFAVYIVLANVGIFQERGVISIPNVIGTILMMALAIWKTPWLHYPSLALVTIASTISFVGRQLPS